MYEIHIRTPDFNGSFDTDVKRFDNEFEMINMYHNLTNDKFNKEFATISCYLNVTDQAANTFIGI